MDTPLERILSSIPSNWPLTLNHGTLVMGQRNVRGEALQDIFRAQGLTETDARDAAAQVHGHIYRLNQQTEHIRKSTHVTSTPSLLMRSPGSEMPPTFVEAVGWHLLKARLEASGAVVKDITATSSPDSPLNAYVRDGYVKAPDGSYIMLQLPDGETLTDATIADGGVAQALKNSGAKVEFARSKWLEGGDILMHPQSKTVFVGINVNEHGELNSSHLQEAQALADRLQLTLVPVAKAQHNPFYHLDTFMSVLPDGSVILLPDATDEPSRQKIQAAARNFAQLELPPKPEESQHAANERRSLATNIVTINGNTLTANALPEVRAFINSRGFRMLEGPYVLFDAGPHCQINFIPHPPSQPSHPTPDGRTDLSAAMPSKEPSPLGNQLLASTHIDEGPLTPHRLPVASISSSRGLA